MLRKLLFLLLAGDSLIGAVAVLLGIRHVDDCNKSTGKGINAAKRQSQLLCSAPWSIVKG